MNKNERQLIGLAQKGCVAAFEELTAPFQTKVYNLMLKICVDEFEASLLSQDVFVRVFEALLSGYINGSLAYNIYRIAEEVGRQAACKSKLIS